jgi:hypothetical protein
VFLSAVLIAGTITALFPSFMIGAQADPYYGMDKDNKKVDKKVSVSSLKCNNINVNVNGLTLDVFPPFLGGEVAATAAEGETDANSFANNGGSEGGSEINDFRFICINNNNNTVIEAPPVPPTPPVDPCVLCFEEFEGTDDLLTAVLELEESDLIRAETALGVELSGLLDVVTIEDLCDFLEALNIELTLEQLVILTIVIFGDDLEDPVFLVEVVNLIACLIDNGIITLVPSEGITGLQAQLQQQLQQLPTTP